MDRPQPPIAPAPPPPGGAASAPTPGAQGGFRTSHRRMGIEVGIVLVLAAGLGLFAVLGGGLLAASLTPLISTDLDRRLGQVAQAQMLHPPVCSDAAAQRYVEAIAQPLVEAAGEVPFEFSFRVVDDASVNAYALPGGFVTVHRGLLEKAESGDEVAGVLAHELQHAILRHGTRRALRSLGTSALLGLLTGGGDLQALGGLATELVGLSYDRDQESEADARGVALLERAGIDPGGLARFFERLAESEGVTPPAILSTHPDPGDRARRVRSGAGARSRLQLPSPRDVACD